MQVNNEKIPREKARYLPLIIFAIIAAIVLFGLLNFAVNALTFIISLIIKYWIYAALVIVGLLIIRKFLFKRKK